MSDASTSSSARTSHSDRGDRAAACTRANQPKTGGEGHVTTAEEVALLQALAVGGTRTTDLTKRATVLAALQLGEQRQFQSELDVAAIDAVTSRSPQKLRDLIVDNETQPAVRQMALLMLHTLDPDAAVAATDEVLWSEDVTLDGKVNAVQTLAPRLSPDKEIPAALRSIAVDPSIDWKLRGPVMKHMVRLRPADVLPHVESLLTNGMKTDREHGLDLLAKARDRSYVPLLRRTSEQPLPIKRVTALVQALADIKDKRWSAKQMLGEPDLPIGADLPTAWASKKADMGDVWIEFTFQHAVNIERVRIRETLNPGAVSKISLRWGGEWVEVWSGTAHTEAAPRWFEPAFDAEDIETNRVRIVVSTNRVKGWNEIDAVELIGADGSRQWASKVRAQSSYAD